MPAKSRFSREDLLPLRHTAAHILAQAVKRLFPGTKLAIGPPTDTGFYYDFYRDKPFTEEDLRRLEEEMQKIVESDYRVERLWIPREEAEKLLKDEPFKLEILKEIPDDPVSFYRQGEFVDLCKGPHVESTGKVRYFKLLSTSGAYWRGDERNPMLQRIYGIAFEREEDLKAYLEFLKEVERRDHRRLARELELFAFFPEEAGPGLVFDLPKGATLRAILEELSVREHLRRGYQRVRTPHIMRQKIWEISGHMEHYRENMFLIPGDHPADRYGVKPMNCPAHILIYKMKRRSYRELPLRLFELGTVYRFERGGTMHGLMRVRGLTQDDAHIFCPMEKLEEEILGVLRFLDRLMELFGFSYELALSLRPEKAIGGDEVWGPATQALRNALEALGRSYEERPGEGAFYGPKIDVLLEDALGRTWQGPTIQVDFNLPERFGLVFVNAQDSEERPVMIHRALYGSFERFMGILIEHYAGSFPTWLAPIQVRVLPISDRFREYALEVTKELQEAGIRAEADIRNETLNYRIRDGQKQKIPYLLIVGQREASSGTVSVRHREKGDLGARPRAEFLEALKQEARLPELPL